MVWNIKFYIFIETYVLQLSFYSVSRFKQALISTHTELQRFRIKQAKGFYYNIEHSEKVQAHIVLSPTWLKYESYYYT